MAHSFRALSLVTLAACNGLLGCSLTQSDPASQESWGAPGVAADTGTSWGGDAGAPSADAGGGSFGGVGTGGAQDFGAFRKALDENRIPLPEYLDAAGFFAEHYTSLPTPTCEKTFCLHGMLSVSKDLARGGDWTLLQMGMNSPIDPATIKKPPLEIAVVFDKSGSMGGDKIAYAKQGVKLLVDALGPEDRFTLVTFDDTVQTVFGPAVVVDKETLKSTIDGISPGGSTNLYDSLQAGYKAIEGASEQRQRRVIFMTDGLATAGEKSDGAIKAMSAGYNEKHLGLTTIGLGSDVSTSLLRSLAEQGGGNFYFLEKIEAVKEVFTEELAFFVAPIAYDLELTYSELPAYGTRTVYGTNLWKTIKGGGQVKIPSVFLVSRTSTKPGPGGGRRGGGSAIIAELSALTTGASKHGVGKISLKYRAPGSTTFESQEVIVDYDGEPGKAPDAGFYTNKGMEKNTLILGFFVAFRDATKLAQTDAKAARALLENFGKAMRARLEGWTDEDLADDLVILDKYVKVLAAHGG